MQSPTPNDLPPDVSDEERALRHGDMWVRLQREALTKHWLLYSKLQTACGMGVTTYYPYTTGLSLEACAICTKQLASAAKPS